MNHRTTSTTRPRSRIAERPERLDEMSAVDPGIAGASGVGEG
jgi:hypothetical protein